MTVDDLDPAAFWFVAVMCLCKHEVDEAASPVRSLASSPRSGRGSC
jgi:hypothetical protein